MTQAKGLYDFDGDPSGGELSFKAGEVFTVTKQDIGNGWWEATNSAGQTGFIPEAFVEVMAHPEPSMPPPPAPAVVAPRVAAKPSLPSHASSRPSLPQQWGTQQSEGSATSWDQQPTSTNQYQYSQQESQDGENYWDDSWDEDDTEFPAQERGETASLDSRGSGQTSQQRSDLSKFSGTIRGWGKFRDFQKMGGEAFLLGQQCSIPINDSDKIVIEDHEGVYHWRTPQAPFTCSVFSPKKDSKMKGLKSFIVYQLIPSFSNIQVSRRYKHFDWLHKRLEEKFPCICVPPLPDKQVSGRFEEDFIQERMKGLQEWVNRMVSHPVIGQCDVLHHFLTCTDDKRWKVGKRKAEKDEFQGAKLFLTIHTPTVQLELVKIEGDVDMFSKFVKEMDDASKQLIQLNTEFAKKHVGPFCREFQKLGCAYIDLSKAFELDTGPESQSLTQAVKFTGETYNEIAELYRSQPRVDLVPLLDLCNEYRGMLSTMPDVLLCHKGAAIKLKEVQKVQAEGGMSESDAASVASRADTIGFAVSAEMNHFQKQRVLDFREGLRNYLRARIDFYNKIAAKLQGALDQCG